jgi:hypothetical protein
LWSQDQQGDKTMRKSIPLHNEGFIVQRHPVKAFLKMLDAWAGARRAAANSRKHDAIIAQLNGHLRHDIGESDYRPVPPTMGTIQMDNAARLEAMRFGPI